MSIRFRCPHCLADLRAPDRLAGRQTVCPTCRSDAQVPSRPSPAAATELYQPDASAPLEVVPLEDEGRVRRKRQREREPESRRLEWLKSKPGQFVIIAVVALIFGAVMVAISPSREEMDRRREQRREEKRLRQDEEDRRANERMRRRLGEIP